MRLHAKDTSWTLDPRIEMPEDGNKEGVQRGIGNQVSIEFNVLYRFHSPISKRDAKWTEDFLHENFRRFVNRDDGKGGVVLTQAQFDNLDIPVDLMRMAIEGPPSRPLTPKEKEDAEKERHESEMAKPFMPEGLGYRTSDKDGNPIGVFPFARDEATGKFDDAQLVKEMVAVMEDPICMVSLRSFGDISCYGSTDKHFTKRCLTGQFGPRNVPKAFRAIEILGILQARKWSVLIVLPVFVYPLQHEPSGWRRPSSPTKGEHPLRGLDLGSSSNFVSLHSTIYASLLPPSFA